LLLHIFLFAVADLEGGRAGSPFERRTDAVTHGNVS